jgi:hypothetical protein
MKEKLPKLVHKAPKAIEKKPKKPPKEYLNAKFTHKTFWPVAEHQPEIDRFVLCYSEVYGEYYIACFNPHQGWQNTRGIDISYITHWCDEELYLPFPIINKFNPEIAEKYGYRYEKD